MIVATDDQRVVDAVESFGGRAVMTSPDHRSGTDRVADLLDRHPAADMSTLASPIATLERVRDPHLVKVVLDSAGYALYFSRAPIPASKSYPGFAEADEHVYLGHLGIYAFRRDFLFRFAALQPTPLEKHEGLEQLRALEYGHKIVVGICSYRAFGIDTPADYAAFVERWRAAHGP